MEVISLSCNHTSDWCEKVGSPITGSPKQLGYIYLGNSLLRLLMSGPAMNLVAGLFSATRDFSLSKSLASWEAEIDVLNLAGKLFGSGKKWRHGRFSLNPAIF